jgi:ABC-type branched-subunit amino acid transport system substrate-binding protein
LKDSSADSLAVSGTAGSGGVGGTGLGATGTGTGTGAGGTGTGGTGSLGGSGTGAGGTGGTGTNNTGGNGSNNNNGRSGACGVPTGGDTTGVTSSRINIGLHAPLTGTGLPFPNESFRVGVQKYFDIAGNTVCGRKIQVDFQDDQYTPDGANAVCRAMARRDYIVLGGAGTDQIQACATNSSIRSTNTPYLSAGVTTNGLTGLPNYFALSLSYEQQGTLVVQNALNNGIARPAPARGGQKKQWAIVTARGKNFEDARVGIHKALNAKGITYEDFQVDQNGNYQASATQQGQRLALMGYKTIYVVLAPGYFVFMAGGYYNAGTGGVANWVGPGVTFTVVTVATTICPATKNAIHGHAWFLSPAPGLDRATAAFKKAYNNEYDDIHWGLWGISEGLLTLLRNASSNLTRENFIARTLQARVAQGTYPPLDFRSRGHFGGTGAWSQRINCNERQPNQDRNGTWDTVGNTYLKL